MNDSARTAHRAEHPPENQRAVEVVADLYGLSGVQVLSDLGLWGETLRLHCVAASGFHFLLKEKPHYLSPDDWPLHLAVHSWAREAGGPVSPLLRTPSGATGVRADGRYFEVQGWVDGKASTADEAEEFGRALGFFHLSVAGMPPGDRDLPRSRSRWTPDDPAGLAAYIDRHCRPRIADGSPAHVPFDELRRTVNDLCGMTPGTGLVESYLHGDTAPANAIRTGDGSLALIDFDDARWGNRVFDLAHATAMTAGFATGPDDGVRTEWNASAAHAVIQGYGSVVDLTPGERGDLGRQMSVATIASGFSCLEIDDPEFDLRPDLAEQLHRLSSLVADIPSVTSAVSTI
ncbi:phosphotransferase enzyme family protein [Streptomyces sp. NBC_00209]|uniref:phosphotransferase enzyme family protein n=1 Tax=Streptomyces sp. NBC_00209 TaxID=2975682 RepID=UPI00325596EB